MKWNNSHTVTVLVVMVLIFSGAIIYFVTSQYYLNQQLQAAKEEKDYQHEQEERAANAITNFISDGTGVNRQAIDAQRQSDVNTILNAVYQYAIDHDGNFPPSISSDGGEICRTGVIDCSGYVDLRVLEKYLATIPTDPIGGKEKSNGAGYLVFKGYIVQGQGLVPDNNKVTVMADSSLGDPIYATR